MVKELSIPTSSTSSNYQLILQEESPTQRWKKMSGKEIKNRIICTLAISALVTLISGAVIAYGARMFVKYGDKYSHCMIYRGGCNGNPKCIQQEAEGICDTATGAILALVFGSMSLATTFILSFLSLKGTYNFNKSNSPENILLIRQKFLDSKNPAEFINDQFISDLLGRHDLVELGRFPTERVTEFNQFKNRYEELENRKKTVAELDQNVSSFMTLNKEFVEMELKSISEDEENLNQRWNDFKDLIKDEFPTPAIEEL